MDADRETYDRMNMYACTVAEMLLHDDPLESAFEMVRKYEQARDEWRALTDIES